MITTTANITLLAHVCVCVCVCVEEGELSTVEQTMSVKGRNFESNN